MPHVYKIHILLPKACNCIGIFEMYNFREGTLFRSMRSFHIRHKTHRTNNCPHTSMKMHGESRMLCVDSIQEIRKEVSETQNSCLRSATLEQSNANIFRLPRHGEGNRKIKYMYSLLEPSHSVHFGRNVLQNHWQIIIGNGITWHISPISNKQPYSKTTWSP